MFSEENVIKLMDVTDQSCDDLSFGDIYLKYSHNVFFNRVTGCDFINCDEILKLKVTDLYGWSDVLCLIRKDISDTKWFKVTAGDNTVIIDEETHVPVYDIKIKPIERFHGERDYPFIVKKVTEITDNEYVRVISLKANRTEFVKPQIEEYIPSIGHRSIRGYNILTKSKGFNVNNIYFFA